MPNRHLFNGARSPPQNPLRTTAYAHARRTEQGDHAAAAGAEAEVSASRGAGVVFDPHQATASSS
jgi:hypothetical protein